MSRSIRFIIGVLVGKVLGIGPETEKAVRPEDKYLGYNQLEWEAKWRSR